MKIIKNLLLFAFFIIGTTVFAQTKVTGLVVDDFGEPLPGASVLLKGTNNGTAADFDGKFTLNSKTSTGAVVISFVGYNSKTVAFSAAKTNLGTIQLEISNMLGEVVVTGVVDIAKDRQTPVAVSTIKAGEIQEKLGSQEFPEILRTTPSIYVTKSGGGFGDSRINVRGFDQRNTAVLINGVPINDMETGSVFWSNWAGLSDVTAAMQVQRGLGSSKLAISSVGGTINVITKTSQQKVGGSLSSSFGNDGYMKFKASYSTGVLDNGLSASVLLSRTQGDGYVDGTKFLGHNYFIGLGYAIDENHQLEFTFTGAPQWHHRRGRGIALSQILKYGSNGEPNVRYNDRWGYLNGEEYSLDRNFYHKPVMSLNHDWKISESSKLSTILYASWGRGGGTTATGDVGTTENIRFFDDRLKDENGLIRFDDIVKWNSGQTGHNLPVDDRTGALVNDRRNGLTRAANINSHNWYGAIVNFHNDANENLSWDLGVDVRTYKGIHHRTVNDLLGATSYEDDRDINNPNRIITDLSGADPSFNPWQSTADLNKIEFNNDGDVNWLGAFGQVEYKNESISTFIQAGISRQGFQRIEYFNEALADQKSGFKNIIGGNVKGGVNYNINDKHNVFANAGFYSKQPLFNAVYPIRGQNDLNPLLTNEKIIGLEFGYGFKHENYNVKLNAYRTAWKDRFLRAGTGRPRGVNENGFVQVNGVEQVHMGVELEAFAKFGNLTIDGMLSLGNYEYKGNAVGTEYNQDNEVYVHNGVRQDNVVFYLDGVKVGDAAQTTAKIGFTYKVLEGLKFDISQFYATNLYPQISPNAFNSLAANQRGVIELPGHSLIDAGVSYKWNFGERKSLNFRFNVNNLANQTYIADGFTNLRAGDRGATGVSYRGVDTGNRVYFGFGRTWNGSVRFDF